MCRRVEEKMRVGESKIKIGIILILKIVCFNLITPSVLANPGLRVERAVIVGEIFPGENAYWTVNVSTEPGDNPMRIQVDVMGFGQSSDGGVKELDSESDNSPYSAREFITVEPKEFYLEPGSSREITVGANVPSMCQGGRYALVRIQGLSENSGDIGVIQTVNVPLLLTLSGTELVREGRIKQINVVRNESIDLTIIFANTGNYHYKAQAHITVRDENRDILAEEESPLSRNSIIPGFEHEFNVILNPSRELSEGMYYAEVEIIREDGTVLDSVDEVFHVTCSTESPPSPEELEFPTPPGLPWIVVMALLTGAIIIATVIFYMRRIKLTKQEKLCSAANNLALPFTSFSYFSVFVNVFNHPYGGASNQ